MLIRPPLAKPLFALPWTIELPARDAGDGMQASARPLSQTQAGPLGSGAPTLGGAAQELVNTLLPQLKSLWTSLRPQLALYYARLLALLQAPPAQPQPQPPQIPQTPQAPVAAPPAPLPGSQRAAVTATVVGEANKLLTSTPDPIRGAISIPPYYLPGQDGVPNPNRDMTHMKKLETFARTMNTLSQAYALTGDARYAEKAVQTADAWARTTTPAFATHQAYYDAYFKLSSAWSNMAALKAYPGWDAARRARTLDWVHSLAEAAAGKSASNNLDLWRRLFVGSAALLTDDQAMFAREVATWHTSVGAQIDERGLMPAELKRTRSLSYHEYALKPIVGFAELARGRGIDLYATPTGQEVRRALEVVGPFLLDPSRWTGQQLAPESITPVGPYALYQVAAARYPDSGAIRSVANTLATRLKQDPNWLARQVKNCLAVGNHAGLSLPVAQLY